MPHLPRRAALIGAAAALPFVSVARGEASTELNFGLTSTEGSQSLRPLWSPFLEDMSKAIGAKVNGVYPSDYAALIEGMRFDKVQLGWFGNASAILAVDRAEGEVFVQKTYADGSKGYYALLIVNKDSPLKSLDDVVRAPDGALTFGNGDPNSTSGFLIPSYYAWAKSGVDVRKHFKTVLTGNHEANLLAVANKQVDVATNNTEDFALFQKNQPQRAANVREIWRSPIIAADPFVWRKALPDAQKQAIRTFFLQYGTERPGADVARERKVLADLGRWGNFVASSDRQLLPVRQVAVFREKLQAEANTQLSPEERAKKITAIDARLAEFDRLMSQGS